MAANVERGDAQGSTPTVLVPITPPAAAATQRLEQGWHPWHSVAGLMGYGRRGTLRNKHVFTLCFKFVLGIGQIVAIAVLSSIASKTPSTNNPNMSEWDACDRPLGPWVIVWAVRVGLGLAISLYSFTLVRPGLIEYTFDPENGINSDAVQSAQTPPPVGPLNGPGQPQFVHSGRVHPVPRGLQSLTTMLSLLSIVWFIASHVLVYTSLNTCRVTSPHLWYLAFSIMSIAYLLIAEVLIVVLFLFFFVPILLMFINLLLICMGRQPLFRANGGINHEIGKLPQQIVDRIPLVMYIPSPPPKDTKDAVKEASHTYPPATSAEAEALAETTKAPAKTTQPAPTKKHRFIFFRRSKKNKGGDPEAGKDAKSMSKQKGPEDEWEANWERGDYPFVKLPENRATCAICLLDFEEPPRKGSAHPSAASASAEVVRGKEHDVQVQPSSPLELQDAGEGATPLRLLACGHAFHQVCLDPWLKDVSGRCPVCQRKVDIEELERLSKKGSTADWASNAITPHVSPSGNPPPVPDPSTHV